MKELNVIPSEGPDPSKKTPHACSCGTKLEPEIPDTVSRRTALGWLVTGINIAVGLALAIPVVRFAVSPISTKLTERWMPVLDDTDLALGQTREVSYVMNIVDGYQAVDRKYTVYLHRSESGVKCFDPACTHLGCKINFQDDQKRYFCPCHGGVFDELGKVVSGPPPSGLVEHPVKIENGKIFVSRKV
jgi:menaquinol-cytochrome c reductase iron-sulfur subunit